MNIVAIIALLLQFVAGTTYHRETIDSLWATKNDHVVITGTIAVLSINNEGTGNYTFRIGDEHGHFVSCSLPKTHGQPLLGIPFNIYGTLTRFTIPDHAQGIMEIAVDKVEPVE